MGVESKLQTQAMRWLKSQGCWVCKMPAVAGIPVGTSDVLFLKEGFYGFLEIKASATAKFQPLQKEFIQKMDDWSYARAVWPENWPEIQDELTKML